MDGSKLEYVSGIGAVAVSWTKKLKKTHASDQARLPMAAFTDCTDGERDGATMLLAGYLIGDATQPQDARGDFVVGEQNASDGWAMSPAIGAFPWYYTVTPKGQLFQGANVFELLCSANSTHPATAA